MKHSPVRKIIVSRFKPIYLYKNDFTKFFYSEVSVKGQKDYIVWSWVKRPQAWSSSWTKQIVFQRLLQKICFLSWNANDYRNLLHCQQNRLLKNFPTFFRMVRKTQEKTQGLIILPSTILLSTIFTKRVLNSWKFSHSSFRRIYKF